MTPRRTFLKRALLAGGALVCAPQASIGRSGTLRLLILGGTGAIGPWHVRAAVARGHRVAVFSRGRTSAELPAGVERLVGDRNGDLVSIRHREWDAVIDLATYGPEWVRSLAKAFEGRIGHYTFISTVSVYESPERNAITTEDSPVLAYTGKADPYSQVTHVGEDYGALKVLCEREAEKHFPGRTLVLRPGYIGGPGDSRALTYWAVRASKGGHLLAAGEPTAPVQYIDVRDMAEWAIRMVEKRAAGVFNAVGPATALSVGQLVNVATRTFAPRSRVTWVPTSWLMQQKDPQMWGTLLFWSLAVGNIMRMSNARALANGLTTRPLHATLRAALDWYRRQPADQQASLITGFKRQSDGSFAAATSPWSDYLEREQELIAAYQPDSI